MATVLADAQDFKFKNLLLSGYLESWDDDLPVNLAQYQYLKRDGAIQEPMGAGAKSFSFRCVFSGPSCTLHYRDLTASVQQNPLGQLIHPRLGTINVACAGIKSRENPAQAIDVLEFTIEFRENQIDEPLRANGSLGVEVRGEQATLYLEQATAAVSTIQVGRIYNAVYAAATAAQAEFQAWGLKYVEQGIRAAQTPGPALQLDTLLASVKLKRDLALTALEATRVVTLEPDVALTPARLPMYLAYGALVQMRAEIVALKPIVVPYMVPSTMPVSLILQGLYGPSARAKAPTFYQLNPIETPWAVSGGTWLQVEVSLPS